MFNVDMWYGDKFEPKKYGADAYFNGNEGKYRGNIYNEQGKAIGDYSAAGGVAIERNFNIAWVD